jgi:hypothetical protein
MIFVFDVVIDMESNSYDEFFFRVPQKYTYFMVKLLIFKTDCNSNHYFKNVISNTIHYHLSKKNVAPAHFN